jgi:hypothetical protein
MRRKDTKRTPYWFPGGCIRNLAANGAQVVWFGLRRQRQRQPQERSHPSHGFRVPQIVGQTIVFCGLSAF